ncbi:MAG: PAS domain S-box protein, partial [bacterium]
TWFYSLCFLALIFAGTGALRLRLGQIQAREQQHALQQANTVLEARVQERTAELSRRSHELEESQNFLGSIIDNLPDMLFVKEAKGLSFVRFNRGGEEILGLSQNEMLGKTDYDFFPKAQADFFTSKDRAVLNSGLRIDISEEPIQSLKGPRWLYTRKVALLGSDGQPRYLLGISQDITERKQAEAEIRRLNEELEQRVLTRTAELRASEQRYRVLYEDNPTMYFTIDPAGKILSVNRFGSEHLDYGGDELVSHAVLDLFHEEDRSRAWDHITTCLKNPGKNYSWELRKTRKNGSILWVREHACAIHDHVGQSVVLIVCEDITAHKELEEAQQRRTERIIAHQAALLELAKSEHHDFDAAMKKILAVAAKTLRVERVSYWSFTEDRATLICEGLYNLRTNHQEPGMRLAASQYPRYFEAVETNRLLAVTDARSDARTNEFTEGYLKPLGTFSVLDVPVWLRGRVVGIICHEHTGALREWTIEEQDFVASIADMLSLSLEAAERTRAERELKESEERLHQLAGNINEVLWMESVDINRLIYVSPIYETVWGRSCESLLQQPSTFIDSVYPEDRERLRAHLSKQRHGEISETEYRIVRPDGTIRWIWDRGFPIQNGDGHIYRSAGLAQDITERKQAAEALRESEQRLREYTEQLEKLVEERASRIKELERQRAEGEKLAATGRMAARIAHEINNPLAGIKNSFLLVKDAIPSSHRYYSYVGRIEKEIDRITGIVRQMFILYRPDPVLTHSFRIDEMIEDVVSLLQTSCRENMVTLTTIRPAFPILVSKPEGLLRQVLYNVIQNAIEASPVQGKVRVELAVAEHSLTIFVGDQGSGIPEAIRSQIFEPFFTTKDNLLTPGIGLGLAISKSIIEVLRGTITFESEAAKGTVFKIMLPMED